MKLSRQQFSWALYDWGNSAFAVVVLSGFYPIFFREYWAIGENPQQITFYLGVANSASSLIIVLIAPALGAIADEAGLKKRLLLISAALGITMTVALFWVGKGHWEIAAALFVLASVGWMSGNVFYDSLLVDVSKKKDFNHLSAYGFALGYLGGKDFNHLSAYGFALGYLGGGLLFACCVAMTLQPQWFGLEDPSQAVRLSFLMAGTWWAIFMLPLLLWVHEPRRTHKSGFTNITGAGFGQLWQTFHEIRQLKPVLLFLLAYWLYIDGVNTVIRMAVDYGQALGFDRSALITALLITQFVGFPAALAFGWLGSRIGAKKGIFLGIAAYFIVTLWASRMAQTWEFYGLAIFIGLVQGGIQSLSRSYYAHLIPRDKAAEFFGFYNVMGKFAAIIGPLMVGWVGIQTGNPRAGMLSLLVLFTLGGLILTTVPEIKDDANENT
jgi:UMF1 family MFS transporter